MALTDKLTAIGNVIREKTGKTELLTLDQMPAEIASITTGSGGEVEPIVLSGNCSYTCAGIVASTYLSLFGNTVSTSNITSSANMFNSSKLKKIPFELNFKSSSNIAMNSMFEGSNLEEVPIFNNVKPNNVDRLFYKCAYLKNIPDNFAVDWDWNYIHTQSNNMGNFFAFCYSLRYIPESFFNNCLWGEGTQWYSSHFGQTFMSCYCLDEIKGLRLPKTATATNNLFMQTFSECCRIKDVMFALEEDGSVQIVNCKSQTVDLAGYIGYVPQYNTNYITNYNSGITADKQVSDDATYQALKDNPDYWTTDINYSRYNHDSAVRTINSLPDTSAYLATAGGTNTIKFKGQSGALTDGGAINTLTEEEIAVATAKGWSVALV